MTETIVMPIDDETRVAAARRAAQALAVRLGFDETAAGRVAIVVTEAATNVFKHGGGGEIILAALDDDGRRGVQLLALDRGRGMASVTESRRDGFSTAGTPGNGLGAIARLAHSHDIFSQPGRGTALLARLWFGPAARPPARHPLTVGGVSVPKRGETECGDGWSLVGRAAGAVVMVVDGLGHGPGAAEAATQARQVFDQARGESPGAVLRAAHDALRATRGAAMAIADVDCERGIVTFAGIGNISAMVITGPGRRNMVSHNGTLGHQLRTVAEFTYPWSGEAVLVLHSDGLTTKCSLDSYPGLAVRDPSLIAGVLYRDFARGTDDATVVVVTEAAA
jgi:anti-sigma regulatory factor (Ser/Thr protein kinase)